MPDFKFDNILDICTDDSELDEMINSIMEWWDRHADDKTPLPLGGYAEAYPTPPRFVELAKQWSD